MQALGGFAATFRSNGLPVVVIPLDSTPTMDRSECIVKRPILLRLGEAGTLAPRLQYMFAYVFCSPIGSHVRSYICEDIYIG